MMLDVVRTSRLPVDSSQNWKFTKMLKKVKKYEACCIFPYSSRVSAFTRCSARGKQCDFGMLADVKNLRDQLANSHHRLGWSPKSMLAGAVAKEGIVCALYQQMGTQSSFYDERDFRCKHLVNTRSSCLPTLQFCCFFDLTKALWLSEQENSRRWTRSHRIWSCFKEHIPGMWGPPVISWFINPTKYSYKYHKP